MGQNQVPKISPSDKKVPIFEKILLNEIFGSIRNFLYNYAFGVILDTVIYEITDCYS